jgi:RsiW-degrading membrane proteinase PrsW (M82 family)
MPESDPLIAPIGSNDYSDIEGSRTVETKDFCHPICQQYFFTWLACTILLLILTGLLVVFLQLEALALIVGSIVPAAVILFLAKKKFHDHVLLGQMIVTFFEAILWMVPLLIFDVLGMSLIGSILPKKGEEVTFLSVLQVLFVSLFFAGFCEEFLKYIVIARLQKSPLISSWKSLLVYGLCAGAGFATAENLSYVMRSDFGTAIVRAFLSVPLHCLTGSILGMMIGTQRFFGADMVPFWKSK